MPKSILVLDDDENFRQLLVRILSGTGFGVIEANLTRDALELSYRTDLALTIVDFKLPDANGITFISRLRESGNNTPVVFVSVSACDPETFKYLRNILRVSLVIQKPIDPRLFLEQIEVLLPSSRRGQAAGDQRINVERQRVSSAVANLPSFRTELNDNPVEMPDPQHEQHQQEMQRKGAMEASVRNAQRDLATTLPTQWENLTRALRHLQHENFHADTRDQAVLLVRMVRATSASLGMTRLADAASKMEGYVRMLDPTDTLSQNILWLEIFRSLADGEAELRNLMGAAPEAIEQKRVQVGRVLLLGNQQTLQVGGEQIVPSVDAKVIFTDDPVQAAMEAASSRFDSAVIDMTAVGKDVVINLARELRMSGLNERLPLAFLHSRNFHFDDAERIFAGCSFTLPAPCDQRQFEACLIKLASFSRVVPQKVLTVDDDRVLTHLIEKVLGSQGMTVFTLNDPINILDTLEKTEPDLVLLDVIMPGLSGYDICKIVRATENWSRIPIVFLTSKSDAQGRASAFQAGANDFLAKPIIPEELIGRVKMQLQRAKQEKQEMSDGELTGLLTERPFMAKAEEMLINAGRNSKEMALVLVRIDQLDTGGSYGMFSSINVLSTVGKLLQSRFSYETVRGVWPGGFCLIFSNEDWHAVETAVQRWVREVEQVAFTGEQGRRFSVGIKTAIGRYPADGFSLQSLIAAAKNRLEDPKNR
jgi:DNA-binding response OmpR family regulator